MGRQAATFMTVRIGDRVYHPLVDPPQPCEIIEKDAADEWLIIKCGGKTKRLSYDEYNDLGYVFYDDGTVLNRL